MRIAIIDRPATLRSWRFRAISTTTIGLAALLVFATSLAPASASPAHPTERATATQATDDRNDPPPAPAPIRVACIGDSITFGSRVAARERNAYPAQLGHRLGATFDVRNFGVGGRTLLRDADLPYVETDAWRDVLAWSPDVAIVMLGTNDTCLDDRRANWTHEAHLERDARAIVAELRAHRADIRILLAPPPPIFPDAPGLSDARRADLAARAPRRTRIADALRTVASETPDVAFLDLDDVFTVRDVVDGVHTTPFGAEALANRFADVIRGPVDPATTPVPSAEYRGAPAGWGGGTWWDQFEALRALALAHPETSVVFLGDSITQGLTGAGDRLARRDGPRPFDRAFGTDGALGLGLSGDRTEHVLFRIEHGALAVLDPDVIVVQIGVNNVNAASHDAESTANGIVAIVESLRAREPGARIIVCGPFPLGTPGESRFDAIAEVHRRLAVLDERAMVTRIDLRPLFLDADGMPNDRMAPDRIHLTSAGVAAWIEAIAPVVQSARGTRAVDGDESSDHEHDQQHDQ